MKIKKNTSLKSNQKSQNPKISAFLILPDIDKHKQLDDHLLMGPLIKRIIQKLLLLI